MANKNPIQIPGKYAVISLKKLQSLEGQKKNSARVKLMALAELGVITFEPAAEDAQEEVRALANLSNKDQEFYVLNLSDIFAPIAIQAYAQKVVSHANSMKATNPDGSLALSNHASFAVGKMQAAMKKTDRDIPN